MATTSLLFCFTLFAALFFIIALMIKEAIDKFDKSSVGKNLIITLSLVISIALIIFALFAPFFFTRTQFGSTIITGDNTGIIGDTMGGIMNPFIAIAATILTFLAFYIQFKANKLVQDQFITHQFENQFFEMLRLHKENVNEMKISGYEVFSSNSVEIGNGKIIETTSRTQTERFTEGRKVFVTMNTELIACYEFVENIARSNNFNYTKNCLLKLSYRIFFFGINSGLLNSEDNDVELVFINLLQKELNIIKNDHKESFSRKNEFLGYRKKKIKLYIKYAPFTGHESRLGHYYRHLYSTIKYVVKKENEGIHTYEKSREYLKILRSQMSNDEQLMLYYNYIIGFGKDWESKENSFFSRYRMLHNLPVDKVTYAVEPRKHFKKQIDEIRIATNSKEEMFEWGDKY